MILRWWRHYSTDPGRGDVSWTDPSRSRRAEKLFAEALHPNPQACSRADFPAGPDPRLRGAPASRRACKGRRALCRQHPAHGLQFFRPDAPSHGHLPSAGARPLCFFDSGEGDGGLPSWATSLPPTHRPNIKITRPVTRMGRPMHPVYSADLNLESMTNEPGRNPNPAGDQEQVLDNISNKETAIVDLKTNSDGRRSAADGGFRTLDRPSPEAWLGKRGCQIILLAGGPIDPPIPYPSGGTSLKGHRSVLLIATELSL